MNLFSYRETWAEISLEAIYENTLTFKNNISKKTKLMAVVKADGYGHGAIEVSKTALRAGANYLAVAILDEAVVLREAGIEAPILVLGYTPPRSIKMAITYDITLTVYSNDVLDEIISISNKLNKITNIHLKIDTGMGRVGVISKEAALSLARQASESTNIHLEGIFTHFANADSDDPTYTYEQFENFQRIFTYLENHKINIPIKHCCNSAATMNFSHMHLDMVRVGISLYGLLPSKDVNDFAFPLKQAMQLKTKVASLKQVAAGKVATIPIGYADGFSRLLSNKGHVLIENKRVPIVGRICMDQTMVDVTGISRIEIGAEVILFGGSNEDLDFISIDEVAQHMGTINYEVVCLIGKRVPRIYVGGLTPTALKCESLAVSYN